jgi:hypothetical protein
MILTALLLGALLQSSLQKPPAQDSGSDATAEGIEILRRILADQIDATFAPDEERERSGVDRPHRFRMLSGESNGIVTSLWAGGQTVSHSRGFHLPGHGVLLVMDLTLPTVEREEHADEPEEPQAPSDDEWDAMRRRVRGGSSEEHALFRGQLLERGKESEIDEAAIERVRETVIKTVARHASRIDGLERGDTITVALHLSGNAGTWWSNFQSMPFGAFGTDEDGARKPEQDDAKDLELAQTYVVAARGEAPEQHLVLEIPLADLDEFAQGGYSRLAPRVRVTRY